MFFFFVSQFDIYIVPTSLKYFAKITKHGHTSFADLEYWEPQWIKEVQLNDSIRHCFESENRSYPIHVCCLVQFPSDLVSSLQSEDSQLAHIARRGASVCDAQGPAWRRNALVALHSRPCVCTTTLKSDDYRYLRHDSCAAKHRSSRWRAYDWFGDRTATSPAKVDGYTVTFMGRLPYH